MIGYLLAIRILATILSLSSPPPGPAHQETAVADSPPPRRPRSCVLGCPERRVHCPVLRLSGGRGLKRGRILEGPGARPQLPSGAP